ncbi:unnamed protein product [Rotaria socialis]
MASDDRNATPNQTNPLESTTSSLNNTNNFFSDPQEPANNGFDEEQILDETSREYLKYGFKKVAKKNDFIRIEELGDAFRQSGQNPSEDVVKDIIEKARAIKKLSQAAMSDDDFNDQVSYSDFLTMVHEYWYPVDQDRQNLEEAFDVLDPKHTAKLLTDDFVSLLKNSDWPEDEIDLILSQINCGDGYFLYDDLIKLLLTPVELPKKKSAQPKSNVIDRKQFFYEIVIPKPLSLYRKSAQQKKFSDATVIYQINGFNQTFDLSLIKDEILLSPSFITQYYNENQTWIDRDVNDCFYTGYVNRNHLSNISVSLCNGLFGTFIYHDIEYFIEPNYSRNSSSWNFEHLLYTHKDLSVSKKSIVRCSVNGKPYFEEQTDLHYYQLRNLSSSRKKRQHDSDSMAKHVEILVAYDESIKEFHSDVDIKAYILALFSYVSHLYSDASIGNNIKIWLVKLIELGKDSSNYIESTSDATDILNRFCAWQREYNIPETYDAAVLLTRIQLCNKHAEHFTNSKCDTLGLTELGTMCNVTSKCAVVRDNGFTTAFTIAHEIAHLIGIRHDNDKICLDLNSEQNIMAPSLTFNHNHYKWSNCSRHYFTQYLESDRYSCLNNVPSQSSIAFEEFNNEQNVGALPGRFNDLDEQCRRAFGLHFEYCKDLSHGPKCIRLYCREILLNSSSCITNHAHWTDGTRCSESRTEIKQCLRGQCRSIQDFEVINGSWSEWSLWSPCTRTCGSAIQKSQRFCDNPKPENGGQYCSGQSTRIRSCEHNLPCLDSVDMLRQRQCAKYNNRMIDPTLPIGVRFEPKYNVLPSERCKLICKVSDDYLERSFIFGDRVDDGTPCEREDETRDICINGICIPFGCDYRYGSNATEDACGVCNGQNRTCKSVKGQKIVSNFGITSIINIPINTTRVNIRLISSKQDQCYLAVKHINGNYILNGLHNLQLSNVKISIDNSRLFYSGSDSSNESISIVGHLKSPLEIQVISIYQSHSPSTLVHWEYYVPLDEKELVRQKGSYSLDYHCDRPCQGYKHVKKCILHEREYDLVYCLLFNISFTYTKESCHDHCTLSWTAKYQQTCSRRCGNGYKRVLYECVKTSFSVQSMDESICRKYVGEKPKDIVPCVGDCTRIGWAYGNWSECYYDEYCKRQRSAECRNSSNLLISDDYCISDFRFNVERCAEAACEPSRWNFTAWSDCDCQSKLRRRNIVCVRHGKQVDDRHCLHEPKPDKTSSCFHECFTPYWQTYSWQPCSATCSSHKGIRYRRIVCSHYGLIIEDNYCDRHLKPIEQESCTTNLSCLTWFTGEWSSCSVTCGQGIQQRTVYCHDPSRPRLRVSDSECLSLANENSKPYEQQNCSSTSCPYWKINQWNNCSGKCGLAKRYRTVLCLHNGLTIDDEHCLQVSNEKPSSIETCNSQLYCPHWTTNLWSDCSVTCGIGFQYRSVSCKNQYEIVSETECNHLDRPLVIKQCYMIACQNFTSIWITSNWTSCNLQTCTQMRTVTCVNATDRRNFSMSEYTQNYVQPLANRICPISYCLEWRVAHWHGCPIKCGVGIEYGSGFHCYTRQMPIRKLNTIECELVEPQLAKPILNRICRRNCIEWRTNELNGVTMLTFNANLLRYSLETHKVSTCDCRHIRIHVEIEDLHALLVLS